MPIDPSVIERAAQRTQDAAAQASQAAILSLQQKQQARLHPGEKSIVLPGGRRISAKPYTRLRQSTRQNWWLGSPEDLILPECLKHDFKTQDGRWCLAWPNSTEEGTTMGMAGSGFIPVLWKEIDKTKGARVKTHEGAGTRKGEGYVYWKRHILVWVEPAIWYEAHIEPILRNLSLLARADEDWAAHVEDVSKEQVRDVIAQGLMERESEQVRIV